MCNILKWTKQRNTLCHLGNYCSCGRPDADTEKVQILGAADVQAAVVVLAGHHPRLPQHLHRRRRALQPARLAHRFPQ